MHGLRRARLAAGALVQQRGEFLGTDPVRGGHRRPATRRNHRRHVVARPRRRGRWPRGRRPVVRWPWRVIAARVPGRVATPAVLDRFGPGLIVPDRRGRPGILLLP
ncbi:hypothetical protein GCM10009635_14330 [Actinocatenispora thailandica]